jgi:hypothetical protein
MKPWLKTLLTFVVVSAASVFGTLFVLILAAGGFRGPTEARVSFSEFLKTTIGPRTTLEEMQSVRPTDPGIAPPKVTVVGGR